MERAGGGIRTRAYQLGRLTPYHLATPAGLLFYHHLFRPAANLRQKRGLPDDCRRYQRTGGWDRIGQNGTLFEGLGGFLGDIWGMGGGRGRKGRTLKASMPIRRISDLSGGEGW